MQRASLRLTLYGHRTQGYVAIRLLFSYPHVEVDCLFDLAVTGLQHPAFLAGGHAPGKSSSIRLFQLGIGLEAMVCGHGVVSSWEAVLPASRERERMATSDVVGKKNCRLEKYSGEGFGRFLRDAGARRPWIDEFGGQLDSAERSIKNPRKGGGPDHASGFVAACQAADCRYV